MAFWITETQEGGFAMGEAVDEAAARRMIESQQRSTVTFHERTGRYRWTVVLDGGKTSHGWSETDDEAWWHAKEALNRPYRGTHHRRPRGLWHLPPA